MSRNGFLFLAACAALLALLGIFALDLPLARFVHARAIDAVPFWNAAIGYLDAATGREISKFLIGAVIAALAGLLLARPATRVAGYATLYVAMVQLCATGTCAIAKNLFGRLRPLDALEQAGQASWFVGGNSFPSGHTAFYFGLFLPLAYLFPRQRWLLLSVPVFVAVARILGSAHFLGDVAASVVVCALLAWAFALAMARWVKPGANPSPIAIAAPMEKIQHRG
jgi:membrane-associated phospholipid phosphatase